ncbi:MAG: deoxyribonuclease IV [Dehalococcoidia bacterium]|nr:deoxyribonuclease IV [Dehalococcoidia bacterium]
MKIGAHIKTAGGLVPALERAVGIGAEAMQIFGSQPHMWRRRNHSDEDVAVFMEGVREYDLGPVFLHGIYLINLAADDEALLEKSIGALTWDMKLCERIGAQGVIFHLGSHKGGGYDAVFDRVCAAVSKVLEDSPPNVRLTLENSAGSGGTIGRRFDELGRIVKCLGDDRVCVCLDTQHTFASGYDIASRDGLEKAIEEFDREVGLERLVAVHANDSKVELGANRDRHENIGEGLIGTAGFENVLSHQAFAELPFYLEVPGFEGTGPDTENVDRLKAIRGKVPA